MSVVGLLVIKPMSQNGMDRPCSRQTREHACGGAIRRRNTPMPRKFDTAVVTTIGIDPGKNTLHLH